MEFIDTETKPCPFCAETIQARAVKCRFCNEFLNSEKAKSLLSPDDPDEDAEDEDGDILFEGRPSLWSLAGTCVRASFFFALAVFLFAYPLENIAALNLSDNQAVFTGQYRVIAALAVATLTAMIIIYKAFRLKMIYYEVSTDRIEFSRGIFDRRVDNIDMFRVVDLKLRRSLLDCILGIGSVTLITTDKTDPEFEFEKLRYPRDLYDSIKKASLSADKKQNVIHLE